MQLTESRGMLMAIGGSEDKEGDCEILKEFVRLAGGPKAQIVLMTVATDKVEEVAREYNEVLKSLGIDDVQVVDVSTREDAQNAESIKKIDAATGIYFTGGDQLHITSLLGGSPMHHQLFRKFQQGTIVAGTSAGASMMGNSMIIKGDPDETPRLGCVKIAPGMDFILGAMIDVHFSQRGRLGRLLTAVAHHPQDIGIGLDENTAMVFTNNHFQVLGDGAVYVIDAGGISHTNLPDVKEKETLALYDVRVHVLARGNQFDLASRRPMLNGQLIAEHEADEDAPARAKTPNHKNSRSGAAKKKVNKR